MLSNHETPSADFQSDEAADALRRIRSGNEPFALLHEEHSSEVNILEGSISYHRLLDEIPQPYHSNASDYGISHVHAIPYAQIKEKGFNINDETPIASLLVQRQTRVNIRRLLALLPGKQVQALGELRFLPDDKIFEERVQSVIENAIGQGLGSSFTISRKAEVKIENYSRDSLLSMYRLLLLNEYGGYLNFVFNIGSTALIGASPERYVTIENGMVSMNPISGTLRKFPDGLTKEKLLKFLSDPKERMELFQVLDEELKQMASICPGGGAIQGPFLKEMSKVVHTHYELSGKSDLDPVDIFRHAMHPPTVISSPLYEGPSVIADHESSPRRYYAGSVMYTGRNEHNSYLKSAIAIRTAEIFQDGTAIFQAGSTVVHDSVPSEEMQETVGKIAGPFNAMLQSPKVSPRPILQNFMDEEVIAALHARNECLSLFHLNNQSESDYSIDALKGKKVLIVNHEDDFCFLLQHMINRMGAVATVVSFADADAHLDDADIVIMGPGTGNPDNTNDPKMSQAHRITDILLASNKPTLSICLGHQILCKSLGMQLRKKEHPSQGIQKEIQLFGSVERVGFYNSFAAFGDLPEGIESTVDAESGCVHAIRGERFSGFQFHPESILSQNGFSILARELVRIGQV